MSDTRPVSPPPSMIIAVGPADERWTLPVPIPAGALVIAADGGLVGLAAAGVPVHHLVGDLDSAPEDAVGAAVAAGTTVHRLEADKDLTDLEAALDLAAGLVPVPAGAPVPLTVVGPGGGRLDHLLADLLLLAGPATAAFEVTARLGAATATIVRPGRPRAIDGPAGAQVSILPLHGPADGVTATGLRWALVDAHLAPGTTRGLSNEITAPPALVAVDAGVLAVVRPGTGAPDVAPRSTPYDPTPGGPRP